MMKYNRFAYRLLVAVLGMALNLAVLSLSAGPVILTNTLPVTAIDVAGSEMRFTASFSSVFPITYQWQVLRNGTTNDIPGATNSTLILTSMVTNDTGMYRLRAADVQGETFSAARSLTVNPLPAPEGNFVTALAAQTGRGSAGTNFSPTWTLMPGSLITGQSPSSMGPGNFSHWGCGTVVVLNDNSAGQFNYIPNVGGSPTEVTCGTSGGTSVTYTLPTATNGYDLTKVVVYGGWGDAGRDQQAYTIYYSTVSSPSNFVVLKSVSYNPPNPANVQCATRVIPATAVPLANKVAAVKFDFTNPPPENGHCGYAEIGLFGRPSAPPVANVPTSSPASPIIAGNTATLSETASGIPPLQYQWQTDSG